MFFMFAVVSSESRVVNSGEDPDPVKEQNWILTTGCYLLMPSMLMFNISCQ